jgi:ABC-type Fe3+ transport system permease subunit
VWLLAAPGLGALPIGVYDQLIATTAAHHGFDPALVKAVIKCESQFNPLAQSPRGAQGLMQLMPATQTLLGVRDAFDPQDNVEAGVAYLAMLRHTFPDNLSLVLAAYNAGPQTVVQAGYSVPLIAETQRYVDCVLQAQDTYRQSGPAEIDGAGPLRVFRDVTFPILKPIFLILTSLSIIWDFGVFTRPYLLIGSSHVDSSNYLMGVYVFIEGYAHSDFGRGAAISLLMLLIVAVMSVFYVRRMVKMGEAR